MGTFFKYSPEEIFDDELYESFSCLSSLDTLLESVTPLFGDCILYDRQKLKLYIRKYIDICKEHEDAVIGIVISAKDDMVDCVMKNFLTVEPLKISLKHLIRYDNNSVSAYLKLLFDRFILKYQRLTNMEFVKSINYYIPNVIQLDHILKNFVEFKSIIAKIYDIDKVKEFEKCWNQGILSRYNNTLYIWQNYVNKKREIKHIINSLSCQFLPCFTITYSFNNYL